MRNIREALLAALLTLAFWSVAYAQNQPVYQSGMVTLGHAAQWQQNGVISDAGGAAGGTVDGKGYLTELGITNSGTPFCINDALITSLNGYHQFCLGSNATIAGATGAFLTYNAYGGAAPQSIYLNLNGTNYPLVFPSVNGLPEVPSEASLAAEPSTFASIVLRQDYAVGFGAAPLYYQSTATPCSLNAGAGDGGSQVPSADGFCWIARFPAGPVDAREWGVTGNGASDDTTTFQSAVAWCNAGGPSTSQNRAITIGNGRVAVLSGSPTITFGCTVTSNELTPGNTNNAPYAITRPGAILLGASQTITVASGTLSNVGVFPAALTPPISFQDAITKIAAFAGTGVTVGGNNSVLRNLLIVGFSQCVGATGTQNARSTYDHLYMDCTSDLLIDQAHDVDVVSFIRGWEFFNGNGTNNYSIDKETVSGAADNGSGAIRLTISSTANMANGNSVVAASVGGAVAANGVWPITVVDGSHIDLTGSVFAGPTQTATLASGQAVATGLASVAGIFPGETVTGTGIPDSTTVLAVDPVNLNVWLSNLATVTGSESLAFASGSYTSGGSATLDVSHRAGTFVRVTNSEENHFTDLFEFGWQIGYNPSTGTQWEKFHNIGCDGNFWVNNTCILVDSNAFRPQFVGVNVTGGPLSYIDSSTSTQGALIRGLYSESPAVTSLAALKTIIQNNGQMIDLDGKDTGSLQYLANYNSNGKIRINGLWTNTRLLNSNLAPMNATATPTPLIVGTASWTPQLNFATGNSGITYGSTFGKYTISPEGIMNISFKLTLTSKGTDTGFADLSNLPSPCISTGLQPNGSGIVGFFKQMDTSVGVMYLSGDASFLDEVTLRTNSTTGTSKQIDDTLLTNTSEIIGNYSCYTR